MTARQPRRRRRAVPAAALPRPTTAATTGAASDAQEGVPDAARGSRRRPVVRREYHVTADYSYVRKDLILITGVSIVSLGFVVGMSLIL
ncbi:MAG: hypothetical protein M0R74_13760 [Dehalococcoidia bacterium]|nr:hypothetical protein [Dehalococcoidia bacterium]